MRQGQQNRRGRGRNRKSQNPLTRSFESSGPDVKIRGTPSHIAEKYISMARDALSSGDPVLAENYLQHAEHYNRIIMTYREQQMPNGESLNVGTNGRHRHAETDDEEGVAIEADEITVPGLEPQPTVRKPEAEASDGEVERPRRRQGGNRSGQRRRRQDTNGTSHSGANGRDERHAESSEGDQPVAEAAAQTEAARDGFTAESEQPDFLKRPVRKPRRQRAAVDNSSDAPADESAPAEDMAE
ncbi:MAG: DUF4167 domain-containing protein [Hyphomicrobiaceae bacterium]